MQYNGRYIDAWEWNRKQIEYRKNERQRADINKWSFRRSRRMDEADGWTHRKWITKNSRICPSVRLIRFELFAPMREPTNDSKSIPIPHFRCIQHFLILWIFFPIIVGIHSFIPFIQVSLFHPTFRNQSLPYLQLQYWPLSTKATLPVPSASLRRPSSGQSIHPIRQQNRW